MIFLFVGLMIFVIMRLLNICYYLKIRRIYDICLGFFFSLVSFGCFLIEFYMYNKDMKYNIRSKKSILKLKKK